MLPVVDKPLIQYAAEEAVQAGIDTLIFITGRHKRAIEDHFDKAFELEVQLEAKHKQSMLDAVQNILPPHVQCIFIRQAEALGLGHAVWCAKSVVGDDPFAVMLADDLMFNRGPQVLQQMVDVYRRQQCSVLSIEKVKPEEVSAYGIIDAEDTSGDVFEINGIVEKPAIKEAPSNFAVMGRYILTPQTMQLLDTVGQGAGGEIQLTDAIAKLLHSERVVGHPFAGKRFDCGNKLGYLKAQVELGLQHDEIGEALRRYLKDLQ